MLLQNLNPKPSVAASVAAPRAAAASQHRELLQRRSVAACSTGSCRSVAATRAAAPQQHKLQRRSTATLRVVVSCNATAPHCRSL